MINKFNIYSEILIETKLTTIAGLLSFKRISLSKGNEPSLISRQEEQGFVWKDKLNLIFPDYKIDEDRRYILVKHEFIDWCSKNIYFQADSETIEKINKDFFIKNPFDKLNNKNFVLIMIDWHSHSLFDNENNQLPQPVHFDYMNGYIHDGCYDLNKALTILSKRSDVKFLNNELNIRKIPYYNSSEFRSNQIDFTWFPSKDNYIQIYKKIGKNNGLSYDKYKAIFDLDFLGLRAAAKYNDFAISDEYK